jgi:triacylglycerol lipase
MNRAVLLVLLTVAVGCDSDVPGRAALDAGVGTPDVHDLLDEEVVDAPIVEDPDGGIDAPDSVADADEPESACEPDWVDSFEEATEIFVDEALRVTFPLCATAQRFAVIAAGMEMEVEAREVPVGSLLQVTDLTGQELGSRYSVDATATVRFSAARSGEVRFRLWRPDGRFVGEYEIELRCLTGCTLEATRHPIVLVHGLAGTDRYFGLLDYYHLVPEHLTQAGYLVYTPVTEFIGPSADRAETLAPQIDEILVETGASSVHLVGHSQGGLDIRVLVSGLGYSDRVASMTTIATPHAGIRLSAPGWLTGEDFGEEHMMGEFAADYPDVEAVPRFSWAGQTCSRLDEPCREETGGEVVDLLLAGFYHAIRRAHADDDYEGANDGLVPVQSSIWGEFLGILPADHLDEVGQIASNPDEGPFLHLDFYLSEARRLRQLELDSP